MPRRIDLENWVRRDAYQFFRTYDKPFFSICAEVDVSRAHRITRSAESRSFFLTVTHSALKAIHAVPELRCRIRGEEVVEHRRVHVGATIARPDDTFAFCYLDFDWDLDRFYREATPKILAVQQQESGAMDDSSRDDLIYLSVIPWVSFTSFEHAMKSPPDSVPRLVFGRHREVGSRRLMPVSLAVHHALADGLHAGRFFREFQSELDALE